MNKTILLPTDFSIESLSILKTVIQDQPENVELDIVFLHGMYLSDSIADLLFFSRSKALAPLISKDFREACDVIRNKYYSKVRSIREELFTGYNQRAFNNLIEAIRVDEVYFPEGYKLKGPGKNSFSTVPYLKKCKVPAKGIPVKPSTIMFGRGQVAEIFFENVAFQ